MFIIQIIFEMKFLLLGIGDWGLNIKNKIKIINELKLKLIIYYFLNHFITKIINNILKNYSQSNKFL